MINKHRNRNKFRVVLVAMTEKGTPTKWAVYKYHYIANNGEPTIFNKNEARKLKNNFSHLAVDPRDKTFSFIENFQKKKLEHYPIVQVILEPANSPINQDYL